MAIAVSMAKLILAESTICVSSGVYNAWKILENGGFHEAADYLNSKMENEATRLWMDRSIAEYKKSLHQDKT